MPGEPDHLMALARKPRGHRRADKACRAKKQHFHGDILATPPGLSGSPFNVSGEFRLLGRLASRVPVLSSTLELYGRFRRFRFVRRPKNENQWEAEAEGADLSRTMLVTRAEEWCVEAASDEEARELLAAGHGHRCHFGDVLQFELERMLDG